MTLLPSLINKDPTELGFPPMLPMELAMNTGTPREVCEAYGLTEEDWEGLKKNPVFLSACSEAKAMAEAEGGSFRMKARTMAELFLGNINDLVTNPAHDFDAVPASVRGDLMKFIVRVAGLDASIDQRATAAKATAGVQAVININLG
jgi:hypothetical protein